MIDPTRHRQLQELDVVGLCTRILQNSRNELYLNMRYLDLSLSSLGFEMDPACRGLGTDGFVIYYHGEYLCDLYRRGRVLVNRAYLHMVLTVCSAIWIPWAAGKPGCGIWPVILRQNL